MDVITIIIPIYNAEKSLVQCLDSVLNQSYKKLEIILIDDGSTDSSGNICDTYAQKDNRVKVVHQKNAGISCARNAGLNIATGKYVMFIDSDDFYEENSCELLYKEVSSKDADLVIGNYIHTKANGEKWENPLYDKNLYDNFQLSINDFKKSFFVMNSVIWNKIFKREFIEKHNLRFYKVSMAEDAIFSTFCYAHATKMYFINDVIYNYRQNESNTSLSTNCSKGFFDQINQAYKMIYDNFNSTNNIGFYRYFYARITPYLLCKLIDSNSLNEEESIEVMKMLEWYWIQKRDYEVFIPNKIINDIIDTIINKEYTQALIKIKEAKEYRKSLSNVEAEKMYAPSKEIYDYMEKSDYKYM